MSLRRQTASEDWLTEEVFNRNFRQERERSPFKRESFERLIRGFPEQELVHHLFELVAAHRTFPRTTQAARLKPYGMNLKRFKTMLRQVEGFAEFIERVNQKCANEDAAWRGFHRAAENIRYAIFRAQRWVRNPSQTVPRDMLCALVYRVKEKTERPQYRHVENLLEAAFAAAKVKNPPFLSAEDIRKLCKRKRTPEPRGGALDCARK